MQFQDEEHCLLVEMIHFFLSLDLLGREKVMTYLGRRRDQETCVLPVPTVES